MLPVPLDNRDMRKDLLMEIGGGGSYSVPSLRPMLREQAKSEPVCRTAGEEV